MLKKYSLKALQSAINHALALDPGFSGKMAPLTGKWLEIVIEPLGVNFFMGFDNTAIKLQDTLTFPADTVIHSSPLGLIRLSLLPASKARSLFNDQIRIQGNIELGQEVKQLFDQIDIDWEGHLAQFTGDIIAHQVGSAWRHARAFGKRMAGSLHANIEEYLHEELRVSPATEELNDFYEDVDKLIMDVDRLQAKMNLLVGRMKPIKQLFRLIRINYILAKNGLDQVVVTLHIFAPFRFIVYFNPWNWFRKKQLTRGEALRITFEELGPIFIKFGQALSTRPDILPLDIAIELQKLQDKVPPFSSEEALTIIEQTFGQSAYEVFARFDPVALASASMAQVHAATLRTGEEVVVKILRPRMHKIIEQDLLLIMRTIAGLAERYWPEGRRLKPREIVEEFEHNLIDELDLQREAANAGQLRRNFHNSPLLYVPEIYWEYTRTNVMVMERIHGIPVSDIPALQTHGINVKKLAERGVEIFFTQVFRDCFFHADMHPGNIFVSPLTPDNPQYICIDFGIIGTLDDNDKRYLAENLYAFFNRDYRRVAQLHVESGWVARSTRIADFESAIRTVCEPIFEKPLKDISFAQVVLRLFQVARRFHMEVQPQLVLLQKTLLAIEGLGRQLYPELDLWTTAKPFLEKWLKEQMGPGMAVRKLRENLPFMVEQLPDMPRMMYQVLHLQKMHLLQKEEETRRELKQSSNGGYTVDLHGFGIGVLTVSVLTMGLVLSQLVTSTNYLSYTAITAVAGAVLIFLQRKKGVDMGISGISPMSLLLIFLIVLALFGAGKLKNIGSELGDAIKNFRKAMNEDDNKS